MDRSKGPLATVLIQNGTLRVGEHIVVGEVRGRVKAMVPPAGRRIKTAGPSVPVEILGLMELPQAGDILASVPDERSARQLVEEYKRHRSERGRGPTLEEVYSRIRAGEVKELNLIVKTDVQGTIDAITYALERLATEHAMVNLLHASSGSITESDVHVGYRIASDHHRLFHPRRAGCPSLGGAGARGDPPLRHHLPAH